MTVGDRIKQRRKELGLTQTELAVRMGYTSRTSICTVETNKEDLTTTRVRKFAEALETTPSYLMGWSDEHTYKNDMELLSSEYRLFDETKNGTVDINNRSEHNKKALEMYEKFLQADESVKDAIRVLLKGRQ